MREFLLRSLKSVERRSRTARLRLQGAAAAAGDLSKPNDSVAWEASYAGLPLEPVKAVQSPLAKLILELTRPGEVLLEAGCGSGELSAELALGGRKVELADFSTKILERAARLFEASGLPRPPTTFCDLTQPPLPWADRAVDVVWSGGVLEHWTDEELRPIVGEMRRVARRAVVSLVPHAGCVLYRLAKHLAEQYGLWPYGREMPRHSLRSVFEAAGLVNVEERPVLPDWAPGLLHLTDPIMHCAVKDWWESLPADDPARAGQGYLLLTVGYCPNAIA